MSDLLETLAIELPHMMSEEYTLIQMRYLKDIAGMLPKLMEEQQNRLEQILTYRSPAIKKVCGSRRAVLNHWIEVLWLYRKSNVKSLWQCCICHRNPQSRMIYGLPVKYWLHKKRYWEYRRSVWRTSAVGTVKLGTSTSDRDMKSNVRWKYIDARNNQRRRQLNTKPVNYDSETSTESESN